MSEEEIERVERRFNLAFRAYREERNRRLRRFFIKVLVMFGLLGLTSAATAVYVWNIGQNNREGLCAIRADAQARIDQTDAFIKENPKGISGISVEQLERSKENSVRTRDALKDLNCPPDTKEVLP